LEHFQLFLLLVSHSDQTCTGIDFELTWLSLLLALESKYFFGTYVVFLRANVLQGDEDQFRFLLAPM